MQIEWRVAARLLGACAVLVGVLRAGIAVPVLVTTVEREANIIAVATLEDATAEAKSVMHMHLRIIRTARGVAVPSLLTAELVPSPMMAAMALKPQDLVPKSLIGATGLWFLKEDNGLYHVLPLASGDFDLEQVFLPLSSPELPDPAKIIPGLTGFGDSISRLVLAALVDSCLSSPSPLPISRNFLWASLDQEANRQDALAAASALIASKSEDHHIIGLVAAIRLGSDSALSLLAQEAAVLQPHRWFTFINGALELDYRPTSESSIAPLRQLAGLRLEGASFDAAVAAALQKIGTKAVLPAMVGLLDSADPRAKLRAARFLSDFALFADSSGNVPVLAPGEGRTVGPWATDATRLYTPGRQPALTTEDYVSFWKSWWAENRVKLGFTGS